MSLTPMQATTPRAAAANLQPGIQATTSTAQAFDQYSEDHEAPGSYPEEAMVCVSYGNVSICRIHGKRYVANSCATTAMSMPTVA